MIDDWKVVNEYSRDVIAELDLNQSDNMLEVRKEVLPVMMKLIKSGWEVSELETESHDYTVMNFFADDSYSKKRFYVVSCNSKGYGFMCNHLVLIENPAAILS
jgi:hypothetical protein